MAYYNGTIGGFLSGAAPAYPNSDNELSIVAAGTYGTAGNVPQIVIDGEGHITSVTNVAIAGVPGTITTQDEGVPLSATVTTLNFVGAGVTASGAGATTTVTIPAGASAVVLDNLAATPYPTAPQTDGVWYGTNSKAGATGGAGVVCIGNAPVASAANSVAIGTSVSNAATRGVAIGNAATLGATASDGIAIGNGATSTISSRSVCIGVASSTGVAGGSIAIGDTAAAAGGSAVALGVSAVANVADGVAIGHQASCGGIGNSIVINSLGAGVFTPNNAAHALALGINASSYTAGVSLGATINGTSELISLGGSTTAARPASIVSSGLTGVATAGSADYYSTITGSLGIESCSLSISLSGAGAWTAAWAAGTLPVSTGAVSQPGTYALLDPASVAIPQYCSVTMNLDGSIAVTGTATAAVTNGRLIFVRHHPR